MNLSDVSEKYDEAFQNSGFMTSEGIFNYHVIPENTYTRTLNNILEKDVKKDYFINSKDICEIPKKYKTFYKIFKNGNKRASKIFKNRKDAEKYLKDRKKIIGYSIHIKDTKEVFKIFDTRKEAKEFQIKKNIQKNL